VHPQLSGLSLVFFEAPNDSNDPNDTNDANDSDDLNDP
jgi:hypothetical protein